jgi:hypothetical protein
MVLGRGLAADRVRPLLIRVLAFFAVMLVLAIVLQNVVGSAG